MAVDMRNRNPSDPWRSKLGAASFAAAKGNGVIQTTRPEALPMLMAEQPTAADNPIAATALTGLDQAAGDGWIIQAMLISPAFDLGRINPADFILPQKGNLDDIRAKLEVSMDASLGGIPPYFGGIIADMQLDTPAVALSLSYGDCETSGSRSAADRTALGRIHARNRPGQHAPPECRRGRWHARRQGHCCR
jgi:hypothetical protein